jgi:hypothetical protein
MTDFLDAMATHLVAGSFGVYEPDDGSAPTIYVLRSPDDVGTVVADACISLVPRGGPVDQTFTVEYGRPNVTVIVRGAPDDPNGPNDVAWALWAYMNQVANETIDGIDFLRWSPNLTPNFLQEDEMKRTEIALEYEVWLG